VRPEDELVVSRPLDVDPELLELSRPLEELSRLPDELLELSRPLEELSRPLDELLELSRPLEVLSRLPDELLELSRPLDQLSRLPDEPLELVRPVDVPLELSRPLDRLSEEPVREADQASRLLVLSRPVPPEALSTGQLEPERLVRSGSDAASRASPRLVREVRTGSASTTASRSSGSWTAGVSAGGSVAGSDSSPVVWPLDAVVVVLASATCPSVGSGSTHRIAISPITSSAAATPTTSTIMLARRVAA